MIRYKMGEPWRPSPNFEDEMMSIQPECDLIFNRNHTNPVSLAAPELGEEFPELFRKEGPRLPTGRSKELQIVGKIREKMLGRNKVGKLLTEADLEDEVEREAETIAMIRGSGSEPCHDFPLKSKTTLPTICSNASYKANGHLPLLLGSEFFKLKPKNSSSELSSSKSADESTNSSSTDTSTTSLQSKTFTLLENEDSLSQSDNTDAKPTNRDTLSKSPHLPKSGIARKLKEQSLLKKDINENTKIRENMKTNIRQNNFITPKELYMKKRGSKS